MKGLRITHLSAICTCSIGSLDGASLYVWAGQRLWLQRVGWWSRHPAQPCCNRLCVCAGLGAAYLEDVLAPAGDEKLEEELMEWDKFQFLNRDLSTLLRGVTHLSATSARSLAAVAHWGWVAASVALVL